MTQRTYLRISHAVCFFSFCCNLWLVFIKNHLYPFPFKYMTRFCHYFQYFFSPQNKIYNFFFCSVYLTTNEISEKTCWHSFEWGLKSIYLTKSSIIDARFWRQKRHLRKTWTAENLAGRCPQELVPKQDYARQIKLWVNCKLDDFMCTGCLSKTLHL